MRSFENNMSEILRYAVLSLLLAGVISSGAQAEPLTWQDCAREARDHHPDLISASEKLKEVTADKVITQSAARPQINGEVSGRRSKATSSNETNSYSYSVTGSQLLYDGFKTSNEIKAASENIKTSQYNYAAVSSDVRLALRAAFVELLKAQELVALTEDIASRRKQNLELVCGCVITPAGNTGVHY